MNDSEYILDTSSPLVIGATGMQAILQNIRMILLTFIYSVPLDRSFANNAKMLDSPTPKQTARLAAHMINTLEKYEPRIKIKKIEFIYPEKETQLMQGNMIPKITFRLKDGVKL